LGISASRIECGGRGGGINGTKAAVTAGHVVPVRQWTKQNLCAVILRATDGLILAVISKPGIELGGGQGFIEALPVYFGEITGLVAGPDSAVTANINVLAVSGKCQRVSVGMNCTLCATG
jgi:hypothetical protein